MYSVYLARFRSALMLDLIVRFWRFLYIIGCVPRCASVQVAGRLNPVVPWVQFYPSSHYQHAFRGFLRKPLSKFAHGEASWQLFGTPSKLHYQSCHASKSYPWSFITWLKIIWMQIIKKSFCPHQVDWTDWLLTALMSCCHLNYTSSAKTLQVN